MPKTSTELLTIAMKAYQGVSCRPRPVRAWYYVACSIYDAMEEAVKDGVLDPNSDRYRFLKDRYLDAKTTYEHGKALEKNGRLNVKL